MRTGRLITSFLQGKATPTTTSTIFSPYVDPATVGNKTGYYNVSHGGIPGTNNGALSKTVGGSRRPGLSRLIRALNDLLPYKIRPIKSKRRYIRKGYTLGVELYTFRLVWRSHHWPRVRRWLKKIQFGWKPWKK